MMNCIVKVWLFKETFLSSNTALFILGFSKSQEIYVDFLCQSHYYLFYVSPRQNKILTPNYHTGGFFRCNFTTRGNSHLNLTNLSHWSAFGGFNIFPIWGIGCCRVRKGCATVTSQIGCYVFRRIAQRSLTHKRTHTRTCSQTQGCVCV